jgi:DNA polymerase III delta subunit
LINFVSLKTELETKFYPVYLLSGKDAWIKSRCIELVTASLSIDIPEFNVITLEQPDGIDAIMSAVLTAPFGSEQKLVVAIDPIFTTPKKITEADDTLNKFAKTADKSTVLIILYNLTECKFRDNENIAAVNCNPLSKPDVVRWINWFCRTNNRTIEASAASKLAEYCLFDMTRVSTEIAKLCDYTDSEIDDAAVDALVHKDTEYAVFDLGKTIASGNAKLAVAMLDTLLFSGEDARTLFSLLYNYYRRLYYIRISNADTADIATHLGIKSGAVFYAKDTAQRYKPLQLMHALQLFKDCDSKIKQFYNEQEALRLLVMQLLTIIQ